MVVAWQDLPLVDALKNVGGAGERQYCEVAWTVIEAVSFVRGNEVINPPSNSSNSSKGFKHPRCGNSAATLKLTSKAVVSPMPMAVQNLLHSLSLCSCWSETRVVL